MYRQYQVLTRTPYLGWPTRSQNHVHVETHMWKFRAVLSLQPELPQTGNNPDVLRWLHAHSLKSPAQWTTIQLQKRNNSSPARQLRRPPKDDMLDEKSQFQKVAHAVRTFFWKRPKYSQWQSKGQWLTGWGDKGPHKGFFFFFFEVIEMFPSWLNTDSTDLRVCWNSQTYTPRKKSVFLFFRIKFTYLPLEAISFFP